MTLMEREMAKDPCIREACAGEGLAIVFLKCGLGSVDVQRVLDDLADVSGYHELSTAPLMFVGHSAGGRQAKALAGRMHSRCFGLVQYRGGLICLVRAFAKRFYANL
jgi:predicted alpha/beta hydrolase